MTRENKITAEEKLPISKQGYTIGKLLDGTECQILLDSGASKSFMSKSHSLQITSFLTQVCFKDSGDSSRKRTICEHTLCDLKKSRHTWS